MGILSFFKRRKKEKDLLPEIPESLPPLPPKVETGLEVSTMENVKAKIELLLTQMDSLRTQYETMNERIKNIEQMVQEIRSYYYSYKK